MTHTPHRAAFPRPATEGSALTGSSAIFETHPVRRRFNAWFFTAFDSYINWLVRDQKRTVFSALPPMLSTSMTNLQLPSSLALCCARLPIPGGS